jgi:hypothetical protein
MAKPAKTTADTNGAITPKPATAETVGSIIGKIPAWIMATVGIDVELVTRLWNTTTESVRELLSAHSVPPAVVMGGWVGPNGSEPPMVSNPHTGRYDGRGIYESQNRLYDANAVGFMAIDADGNIVTRHITDYQIIIAWCENFPKSACKFRDHTDYAAGARRQYLTGKHADPIPANADAVDRTWAPDGVTVARRPYVGPDMATIIKNRAAAAAAAAKLAADIASNPFA